MESDYTNTYNSHDSNINFNNTIKSIKKVDDFDYKNFISKYMKPC